MAVATTLTLPESRTGWCETADNEALVLNLGSSVNAYGMFSYILVDA